MNRKKKIVIAQITFFVLGVLILIITYYNRNQSEQIISKENENLMQQ